MYTPEKTVARIRDQRRYQPSAIGNSLFMLLVRYISLMAFFILAGISIYIYASSGNLNPEKEGDIDIYINRFKDWVHLKSEDVVDQAYLLMIIAVMFLVVYKLTTMVLRRNNYIFMINEVLDEEDE